MSLLQMEHAMTITWKQGWDIDGWQFFALQSTIT
jgi:hypothetical protein